VNGRSSVGMQVSPQQDSPSGQQSVATGSLIGNSSSSHPQEPLAGHEVNGRSSVGMQVSPQQASPSRQQSVATGALMGSGSSS
jgi:hypothetical protein